MSWATFARLKGFYPVCYQPENDIPNAFIQRFFKVEVLGASQTFGGFEGSPAWAMIAQDFLMPSQLSLYFSTSYYALNCRIPRISCLHAQFSCMLELRAARRWRTHPPTFRLGGVRDRRAFLGGPRGSIP
jgi:hypothetical protein